MHVTKAPMSLATAVVYLADDL